MQGSKVVDFATAGVGDELRVYVTAFIHVNITGHNSISIWETH